MESRLRVVSTCDGPLPFSKSEAWRSKEGGEQHSRRGQMLRWLATPLVATVLTLSPGSHSLYERSTKGFGEKCTPRGQCTFGARLQDEEIKLLAEFIKSQADSGWPNVKSSAD
ncbi:hypothetical protein QJS10_CPB11g01669 [Acorus calamus]|uniref:Cytochrome c-553 n=1 Tax=Acorus calamus TaxID=4465 RepID=A0AAV9DRI9_ACOCL|nr:hypothetical protein QJS10_CPB11g01669 [Acorus calamus]